jgi:amidase
MGSHDGMDAVIGSLGPIATSARDLALFCRIMLQYQPWLIEPQLLEIPWKQATVEGEGQPKQLSIAILWDDGVVAPHPPIMSALHKTRKALIAAGHEVVDWPVLSNHQYAWDLLVSKLALYQHHQYSWLHLDKALLS